VDPARIREAWPFVSDHVMRAVLRGRNGSYAEIAGDVLAGHDRLWLAIDNDALIGSVVTGIRYDGDRRICIILACAGDVFRARHLLTQIETRAMAEGCRAIRIYGRRGWRRVLRDYRPCNDGIGKELI
jgi:hypothetical protein